MSNLKAEEVLDMICYQYAGTKEIMKIGSLGEVRALKIKKEITTRLKQDGYTLPRNKVPMEEVVKYFKINIDYLKKVAMERNKIKCQ